MQSIPVFLCICYGFISMFITGHCGLFCPPGDIIPATVDRNAARNGGRASYGMDASLCAADLLDTGEETALRQVSPRRGFSRWRNE
jgi:hypothetical protein